MLTLTTWLIVFARFYGVVTFFFLFTSYVLFFGSKSLSLANIQRGQGIKLHLLEEQYRQILFAIIL